MKSKLAFHVLANIVFLELIYLSNTTHICICLVGLGVWNAVYSYLIYSNNGK
jgi:hypothetical protein